MKLVHLSDLHFGTENVRIIEKLQCTIDATNPDLVVVSGDFTQIASSKEFSIAQEFLNGLKAKVFCVPGNHDIPRFHLWERLTNPYKKYKIYIHDDLRPVCEFNDVIIAGINTARRVLPHWNWANGAISQAQLEHLRQVYKDSPAQRRICVFHHPIQTSLNSPMNTVVFGAKNALQALNNMKVDLVLTGHVHHASVTTLGDIDHKTVYVSASTAISSRLRQQENGFNVIAIENQTMNIEIYVYDGAKFSCKETYTQNFT